MSKYSGVPAQLTEKKPRRTHGDRAKEKLIQGFILSDHKLPWLSNHSDYQTIQVIKPFGLCESRVFCSSVPTAAEEHHGTQSTEESGGGLGDDAHIVDESIITRPSVSRPEKGNATYVGKGGSTT